MVSDIVSSVDLLAAVLTAAYIARLLIAGDSATLIFFGRAAEQGGLKRSLNDQHIARRVAA